MSNQTVNQQASDDIEAKLVSIRRVAKVVKGGRRFGFSALVIVGDGKGKVGYGIGKAKEVLDARNKAEQSAKKSMIKVPLKEARTLHHDVKGKYGAGKVILRAAGPGTGVIAGGPLRAVFETLGIHDIVAKSLGTSNPHNMVKACFDALKNIMPPRDIANNRGKKIGEIIGRRESSIKPEEVGNE